MSADVFGALANPTRREILALLRAGPQPVKELAAHFPLGRPAISEHLAVLREAGLVRDEPRGREHFYHLQAEPLREVSEWLSLYESFWQQKLSALHSLLEEAR